MSDKSIAGRVGRDLLVVFDVAMRERCVHRSAVRLGLTELEVRTALEQLDHTLGEPVFRLAGDGLTPTACAERLVRERSRLDEPESK